MSEPSYRIRPLEWDRIWYGATATTVFGVLFVSNRQYKDRPESDRWASGVPASTGIWWTPAASREEAQEAAEAWYRARLLPALDAATKDTE